MPLLDLRNGPLITISTLSYGAPTTNVCSELLFFYISSYTPMSCICKCILYQKCISLTLDRVFFIYKCYFVKVTKPFPLKHLGLLCNISFPNRHGNNKVCCPCVLKIQPYPIIFTCFTKWEISPQSGRVPSYTHLMTFLGLDLHIEISLCQKSVVWTCRAHLPFWEYYF